MTDNPEDTIRQTASDDVITVERTFELKETVAVSTVVVQREGPDPAVFRIVDSVPEDVFVTEAEFKGNTEPLEGSADETGVSIEGIVRPGEPETFIYGYALSNPEDATRFDPPQIEKSIRMDSADTDDGMPLVRGARSEKGVNDGGIKPDEVDRSTPQPSFLRNVRHTLFGRESSDEMTSDTDDDVISGMQFEEAPTEGQAESQGESDEPSEDQPPNTVDIPDDLSSLFSGTDPPGAAGQQAQRSNRTSESLVAELTRELRSGAVSEDEIEVLREELRMHRSRSTDVRLSYLQARLDRLAAYTDALEELIDKYGTGTEIVDGLLDRIYDLREDLDEVIEELDQGRHHRLDNQNRISEFEQRSDAIAGELDDLREAFEQHVTDYENEVSRLTERIESQRSEFDDSVSAVQEETERIEADMAADIDTLREDIQTSLEQLRNAVEQNTEFRRRLGEIAAISSHSAESGPEDDDDGTSRDAPNMQGDATESTHESETRRSESQGTGIDPEEQQE